MLNNKIITIFGGSGFLGRYIVKELAKSGATINVVSRNPEQHLHLKTSGSVGQIRLIKINIHDSNELQQIVAQSNIVINAIGILYEKHKGDFTKIHTNFPERLAICASKAGIEKLIHISALGVDQASSSKYALSKLRGEEAISQNFANHVILRPSVVFGKEDNFINQFATIASFSPFLPLIGGGHTEFQPVYVNDIAKSVAKIASTEHGYLTNIYELGGPEVLTFKEILELILKYTKRKRILLPLSWKLAKFAAFFLEKLPQPLLTCDQVKLLKIDNVTQKNSLTFFDLQIQPQNIEEIIPTYLSNYLNNCYFNAEKQPSN